MDVNGTKYHLLLTRDDWARCRAGRKNELLSEFWRRGGEAEGKFDWDENAPGITLPKRIFKFTAAPKDEKPALEGRRGAARDRYGNWYWIEPDSSKIKVFSRGSQTVTDFYPSPETPAAEIRPGAFRPLEKNVLRTVELRGLCVTIDHFLVAGTIAPAGLLVFDLFAGGAPRRISWREGAPFSPFDIAARRAGGVFVLDRANKSCWTLDRNFGALAAGRNDTKENTEAFQPVDAREERKTFGRTRATDYFSALPETADPIAIEALPDDTFLILDLPPEKNAFSIVCRYYRGHLLDKLELPDMVAPVDENARPIHSPPERFRLRGFDMAFLEAGSAGEPETADDRLFIVAEEGNQAFSFRLRCRADSPASTSPPLPACVVARHFELEPIAEYYPLRLFSGKGLTAAGGEVYYDFGARWLALKKQNRPRFETLGTLETEIFDGQEPHCVWHRLLLDACLPPETTIEVFSRAGETEKELLVDDWDAEPPLYLRGDGSELPFAAGATSKEKGAGTWELLLQRAQKRFLQLRLVFRGNGQRTPRVSALRVYYPRFSYLENYLPAIYREDEPSAFFLDGFLSNIEGFYTAIEDRIAAAEMLFDVRSAPPDALEWLADWLGAALDPAWSEDKRRLFISRAVDFFRYRGTARGIRIALRLALDACADESIFEHQTDERRRRDPVRIVEGFQTRRTPEIIPADAPPEFQNLPRLVQKGEKWQPNQGAAALHRLYGEKFAGEPKPEFPLTPPSDAQEAAVWERFAREALGFVPSDAALAERRLWQGFLRDEHLGSLSDLNRAHDAGYRSFEEIRLPRGTETSAALKDDWRKFVEKTRPASGARKLWQDFLARRYRRTGRLNETYETNWDSFAAVSLFDRLPFYEKQIADWLQFEGGVLPMHRAAHRFTVMIPALVGDGRAESIAEQNRRLALARRVVELEKPAHTIVDFRFYWNLFRLDEVRLGFDTLLGLGSRDPLLNPLLIAGESFLGESRLGVSEPEKYAERYVLGSEFLDK
ncbi:MAG TPA: phage tail protein [Pyrinomonadaceae bacterium]|jgi:phage tail-like protein